MEGVPKRWSDEDGRRRSHERAVIKTQEGESAIQKYGEHEDIPVKKPEAPQSPIKKPESLEDLTKEGIALVDLERVVDDEARAAGEQQFQLDRQAEQDNGGFFRRSWNRMVNSGFRREYLRQNAIREARDRINETHNVYVNEANPDANAQRDFVAHFVSEYHDDAVRNSEVKLSALDGGHELNSRINQMLQQFALGALSEIQLQAEVNDIVHTIRANYQDVEGVGPLQQQVSNIVEMANRAKAAYRYESANSENQQEVAKRLEALKYDLTIGEAASGIRTQEDYNPVDRLVKRLKDSGAASWLPDSAPAIIGGIYSAALFGAVATGKKLGWVSLGGAAVAAGAIKGANENQIIKEERAAQLRDVVSGRYNAGLEGSRREQLATANYETIMATVVTDRLNNFNLENPADQDLAVNTLTDLIARRTLASNRHIDLIAFSSPTTVVKERLELAKAQAKVTSKLQELAPDKLQRVNDDLQRRQRELLESDDGILERDQMFNRMKRNRVAATSISTVAGGFLFGAVASEVSAGISDNQVGGVERVISHLRGSDIYNQGNNPSTNPFATILEKVWLGTEPTLPNSGTNIIPLPDGATVSLPDGFSLQPNGTNFDLVDPSGNTYLSGLSVDADGGFDANSQTSLNQIGVAYTETANTITNQFTGSAQDYINQNPGSFESYARDWMDNRTTAFDLNEQKLWWGGNGTGIDNAGNFVMDVSNMTDSGSFDINEMFPAKTLSGNGELTMLFTLSADTVDQQITVPINANGEMVLDPNTFPGNVLFKEVNGQAVFQGFHAEAAYIENGEANIFATHIGEKALDTLDVTEVVQTVDGKIEIPKDVDNFIPFMPLAGRREMGPGINSEDKDKKIAEKDGKSGQSSTLADDVSKQIAQENSGKTDAIQKVEEKTEAEKDQELYEFFNAKPEEKNVKDAEKEDLNQEVGSIEISKDDKEVLDANVLKYFNRNGNDLAPAVKKFNEFWFAAQNSKHPTYTTIEKSFLANQANVLRLAKELKEVDNNYENFLDGPQVNLNQRNERLLFIRAVLDYGLLTSRSKNRVVKTEMLGDSAGSFSKTLSTKEAGIRDKFKTLNRRVHSRA